MSLILGFLFGLAVGVVSTVSAIVNIVRSGEDVTLVGDVVSFVPRSRTIAAEVEGAEAQDGQQ